MNPWIQVIIAESPKLIAWLKEAFGKKNPDAPVPTNEEVIAGLETAFNDSLAKDQILKAALQAEIDAAGGEDA